MAEKLTKRRLDALLSWARQNPGKERLRADAEVPGFYARARRGGVEFIYRTSKGRRTRRQIGKYGPMTLAQARDEARELHVLLRRGGNLAAERREEERRNTTLADVADRYLTDLRERAEKGAKKGRRSTHAAFQRLLNKHVFPRLGATAIADVKVEAIRRLHRSLHSTPGEANRMLTALSAVLGFAEQLDLRPSGSNPCRLVKRFEETGERRALTRDELKRLGEAMREAEHTRTIHPSAILALRLLALTGLRRSEVLGHESKQRRGSREGLRWGDVALETRTIHLRRAKAGPRIVPLGRPAVELLRAAKREDSTAGDPVCPGEIKGRPFVGIDRPRGKLYAAGGIEGADLHSLRHTFASVAFDLGLGAYAGPLLGHAAQRPGTITERYLHPDREVLGQVADQVAGAIAAALAGGDQARVLPMRRHSTNL